MRPVLVLLSRWRILFMHVRSSHAYDTIAALPPGAKVASRECQSRSGPEATFATFDHHLTPGWEMCCCDESLSSITHVGDRQRTGPKLSVPKSIAISRQNPAGSTRPNCARTPACHLRMHRVQPLLGMTFRLPSAVCGPLSGRASPCGAVL